MNCSVSLPIYLPNHNMSHKNILINRVIQYKDHLIEIEDFGDNTLLKFLKNKKNNKELIFKKILKILSKLQSIKDKHVINFKNQKYKVKKYDNKILSIEANLFSEWYAPRILNSFKIF